MTSEAEIRIEEDAVPIGAAAAELGLSDSTLRQYDTLGLAVFPRDHRGYRWVGRREVQRVRAIREYIQANRLNLPSMVALAAHLPCWLIKNCDARRREACVCCLQADAPCWSVHRDAGGCLDERCVDCTLYRDLCDWVDKLRNTIQTFTLP